MRPARATSKTIFAGLLACACFRAAQAGPSTSANYSIVAETTDFGGKHAVSGAYANDGSLSAVAGLSAGATPVETLKSGYVGQLYDVTGLSVTSSSDPATVNGGATLLLGAWQILDDGSYLAVDPGSVTWMVVSGPITGISPEGLATAGAPSQNMGSHGAGYLCWLHRYARLDRDLAERRLYQCNTNPDRLRWIHGDRKQHRSHSWFHPDDWNGADGDR
ncbi:MAG: hypothetical protein WDN28_12700 [Chthoniobacter sp.]